MVYCENCGTKNEEEDEYCSKCGTPLKETDRERRRRERRERRDECFGAPYERRRQRDECFGLPHGSLIIGIVIGLLLIVAGLSSIYRFQVQWQYIGAAFIVLIGLLIIAGTIYQARKRG